jgi:hypothetical protein
MSLYIAKNYKFTSWTFLTAIGTFLYKTVIIFCIQLFAGFRTSILTPGFHKLWIHGLSNACTHIRIPKLWNHWTLQKRCPILQKSTKNLQVNSALSVLSSIVSNVEWRSSMLGHWQLLLQLQCPALLSSCIYAKNDHGKDEESQDKYADCNRASNNVSGVGSRRCGSVLIELTVAFRDNP